MADKALASKLDQAMAGIDIHTLQEIVSSPLKWAETFLTSPVTHPLSEYKGGPGPFSANYVQQQILNSNERYNVIRVHRRAGKSYSLAILALHTAVMLRGGQVLIIAPAAVQVQEIFTTIREFIRVNDWIQELVASDTKAPAQRIEIEIGNQRSRITGITAGSSNKSGGKSSRGQGADLFLVDEGAYLHDDDWTALTAIMKGDSYRRNSVKVFVASTPAAPVGRYYDYCTSPKYTMWNRIHVGLPDNPEISAEEVVATRELCSDLEWVSEYLADFPEIGNTVFKKEDIEGAWLEYSYKHAYNTELEARLKNIPVTRPRTMGVDWDKHQADGSGPNISIVELQEDNSYKLIYRREIPQSIYCLTEACKQVIELDKIFKPRQIFVDRGYGEMQMEHLELHAKATRDQELAKKLHGVTFSDKIDIIMPLGGTHKKDFKEAMINLMNKLFEDKKIITPTGDEKGDKILYNQLLKFKVKTQTASHITYVDGFDHAISSLGLACMAMHLKVKNPYLPTMENKIYQVPIPEAVPKEGFLPGLRSDLQPFRPVLNFDGRGNLKPKDNSFDRGFLGNSPTIQRKTF